MKNKVLSILLILVLSMGFLAGCGTDFISLSGGPALNDAVTSNGGMSVRKGDYLYFVNGYINHDLLVEGANEYGDEENSAIYRAQLNEAGELMYDEENNLINVKRLVPKVVGFKYGGFYIFDNYIYYATPTILKDKTGEVRFDLLDFFRADLNGDNPKKIYATSSFENGSFYMTKIENTVHLIINTGSKLLRVNANSTNASATTMVNNVTAVVYPEVTTYNKENNLLDETEKYVYYTRPVKEDEMLVVKGNVLAKMEIGTTTEEVLEMDAYNTYNPKFLKYGNLYYTRANENSVNSKSYYRAVDAGVFKTNPEVQLTGTAYANWLMHTEGTVIAQSDDSLVLISDVFATDGIELIKESGVDKLLFVSTNYAYFTTGENKTLTRINIDTKEETTLGDPADDGDTIAEGLEFDYDGEYVYYFVTYTSDHDSVYLKRAKVVGTELTNEFVGVFEKGDEPIEETEEETTTE